MSNHVEATEAFRNAMLDSIGYAPDDITPSGNLTRFKIDGKLNGWYVLHIDGCAAGSFGDWKQGIKIRWKMQGNYPRLSESQRADFKIEAHRQRLIRQSEEDAKHKAAATKAASIWIRATSAAESHPYLIKKNTKTHGARLCRDGRLIVPLQNSEGKLVNLQFISETGEKRFLKGGLKKGCFHILNGKTDFIQICEGVVTGFSLFEATGHLTVIAFDAGNLEAVAIVIRKLYSDSLILICGDNDESGVGQKAARAAALAIGGKYLIPKQAGKDWNDELSRVVCYE
jgi:putative DNA primase/helicase